MRQITLLILCLFSLNAFGQSDSIEEQTFDDTTKIFTAVETMPEFLHDGEKGLMKIISESVKYPPLALKDKVGGIVKVQFTVDTTGNVTNIKILQSIREDIDNEAMRVVGLFNGWRPGTQNEKKVRVVYTMRINFWPNDKFKRKYLSFILFLKCLKLTNNS